MQTHAYGPDPAQFGELSVPTGDRRHGTVVIVHGGYWRARYDLALGRPLAANLVARGYAVWNLEYRRVGNGGGWPSTFADVAAGIDALADLDVDSSRVAVVGHSAGGHLGVWAAGRGLLTADAPGANPRVTVCGVVAQAGVLSLGQAARQHAGDGAVLELMGAAPDEDPVRYRLADPIAALPITAPVLCLHSPGDANVPYSHSVDYVAAATAAGGNARLHTLDGDHFSLIDPSTPDWAVVVDALPELLSA